MQTSMTHSTPRESGSSASSRRLDGAPKAGSDTGVWPEPLCSIAASTVTPSAPSTPRTSTATLRGSEKAPRVPVHAEPRRLPIDDRAAARTDEQLARVGRVHLAAVHVQRAGLLADRADAALLAAASGAEALPVAEHTAAQARVARVKGQHPLSDIGIVWAGAAPQRVDGVRAQCGSQVGPLREHPLVAPGRQRHPVSVEQQGLELLRPCLAGDR